MRIPARPSTGRIDIESGTIIAEYVKHAGVIEQAGIFAERELDLRSRLGTTHPRVAANVIRGTGPTNKGILNEVQTVRQWQDRRMPVSRLESRSEVAEVQ